MKKYLLSCINFYLDRPINNLYKTTFNKKVLISYITAPFRKKISSHTNSIEVAIIAEVFHELGYQVYIVNYNKSYEFNSKNKFDVVFGFGVPFKNSFFYKGSKEVKRISYATGAHNSYQNNAEIERIRYLHKRKGLYLSPKRVVDQAWSIYSNLSNLVIVIGNDSFTVKTFQQNLDSPIRAINLPLHDRGGGIVNRDYSEAKKHFLWFGSGGLVHKGLDLCIDVFSKLDDYHLHICGPKEDVFFDLYEKELQFNNIHYHGFVDLKSDSFKSIVTMCAFTLFPSCSEGMSGSLLTTMSAGLLPLATKETGVDRIDDFGFEVQGTLESIEESIYKAVNMDDLILANKSKQVSEYMAITFTEKNFKKQLMTAIQSI